MSHFIRRFAEKYYSWGMQKTGFSKSLKFFIVDFDKPWWKIVTAKWPLWFVILSGRVVSSVFITLVPLFVGIAFKEGLNYNFWLLSIFWFFVETWRFITVYLFNIEQARITYGLEYSAYRYFLTVDPIYHAMRTSGRLFAKIRRGSHAYEDLLMVFVYELLTIFTGTITVIGSLFVLDRTVGFISLIFLFFLSTFNIATILFNALSFEKNLIKADDDMKTVGMESLVQIELVRSSFAADQQNKEIRQKSRLAASILATHWVSFASAMFVLRIAYGLSVSVLGIYILSLIKNDAISVTLGTSFLATYIHGSYRIMRIGEKAQKVLRCIIRIQDLFDFVRTFGLQTFPVLEEETSERNIIRSNEISILVDDLDFAYTSRAQIFEGHSLHFIINSSQKNKLYGIIGPSGVGKTTLISILGGQLRPTTGAIRINGIPMYEVDDKTRRQLVALQGQTASNLSGSVRESLLLGLPKRQTLFSDVDLIAVLERVGLWGIFQEKEGLDSAVGEGGFNLSVGQRQRLNFASLYLRTKYFNPLLILIDEPTSSLDEVSEQAITDMIDEIAQDAVTFVIAHRLNTLQEAVGILDVSLLDQEKQLIFYSRKELLKKSLYYKKLISGEVSIGEE